MPSIITHDTFGRELYSDLNDVIGQSEDEKHAFLLGCQGPDIFFYGLINPLAQNANKLAGRLHRKNAALTIASLAISVDRIKENKKSEDELAQEALQTTSLPELKKLYRPSAKEIARAYCLGFLMHWELDATVHPFIYSQQYAYCDAGVEGLDRSSQSEVHVEIEKELDELVLTVKRGETISTFDPSVRTLQANKFIVEVINKMFEFAVPVSQEQSIQPNLYGVCLRCYRQVERWLYSTTGVKRNLLGRVEEVFRKYSIIQAMAYENVRMTKSIFDNSEREAWVDPWTKETRRDSFWDLYNEAIRRGTEHTKTFAEMVDALGEIKDDREKVQSALKATLGITQNVNFSGIDEKLCDPETGKPRV